MTEPTKKLVAVHAIRTGTGAMLATGHFDRNGDPIMRPEIQDIAPGTVFDAPHDLAAELLASGAAALPGTDAALAAVARASRERG